MLKDRTLFVDIGQGLMMQVGSPAIAVWDKPTRPKKPKRGTLGFNRETNKLEFYNGSYWLTAKLTDA